MTETGVEGTVLGTLVMPYCSGIGNLIFVFVVYTKDQPPAEVMTNCLVNNVTNMTLLIGLPAIFWGLKVVPKAEAKAKKNGKNKNDFFHGENSKINANPLLRKKTGILMIFRSPRIPAYVLILCLKLTSR